VCAEAGTGPGDPLVSTVGPQNLRLRLVFQVGEHYLIDDMPMQGLILDQCQSFDAQIKMLRHRVAGAKTNDAGLLEEAPNDRFDSDVFGHPPAPPGLRQPMPRTI